MRKTTFAAAALLASLGFLAGCQSGGGSPAGGSTSPSAPAPAARPADELSAAILKLGTTSYRFTADVRNADITGAADPATKAVRIAGKSAEASSTVSLELVSIGTDLYAKVTGLGLPIIDESKWLHLDGDRVKSLQRFGISSLTDPVGLLAVTMSIKDVRKTGDRTYQGTFDLSKPMSGITDAQLKALAEKAKNIPFDATLDAQGNLVGFRFTVPAVGSEQATPVALTLSDHGSKVDISAPPAGQVVEAPEVVYQLLNA